MKFSTASFLLPLVLFSVIFSIPVKSADLILKGCVKGINYRESKNKGEALSAAVVSAESQGEVLSVNSNRYGYYILNLKSNRRYLITVSRQGYNHKSIWIDSHGLPTSGKGMEGSILVCDFTLLSKEAFPEDISIREDMGQFKYDASKGRFVMSVNNDYKSLADALDYNLQLIRQSEKSFTPVNSVAEPDRSDENNQALGRDSNAIEYLEIPQSLVDVELALAFGNAEFKSLEEIRQRQLILDSAKIQLRTIRQRARTKEDSLIVAKLEAQLRAAEGDLVIARETILFQRERISMQNRLLTIYILSILFLSGLVLTVLWFYREKRKTNRELAQKNNLISEGINYATTIQNSFLKTREELSRILPECVLFFRPRDQVSGDIYWLSERPWGIATATIDCTGHGVPGAFISMIANTLLNEIVNNRNVRNAGKILEEMHTGVMEVLQQDAGGKQSQDGMDMSLLLIDKESGRISFAGARNHLYIVRKGILDVIRADVNSIGGRSMRSSEGFTKKFNTREVEYRPGDLFFLSSDGFIDQFGGSSGHKFNLDNFKSLLIRCAALPWKERESTLSEVFDSWKGENEQVDDVLLLGFRM